MVANSTDRRWLATLAFVLCGNFASLSLAAGAAPEAIAAKTDASLSKEIPAATSSDAAKSAGLIGDEGFARRLYLDLWGVPPTPEEVTAFVLDPSLDKRAQLAKRLLADSQFGTNWARYWRDVILYRRSEDRALLSSGPVEKYLAEQFNKGTPWDDIAKDFITATGDILEDGRTALIMAQMGENEEITAEISRIFMGVQIQCAQCHDHPTDRWKRKQFHELAAFFPRIAVRPKINSTPRSFEVVSVDFARRPGGNPNAQGRGALEHYMPDLKDPTAQGDLMQPKFFVTNRTLETGKSDIERRTMAANWITASSNPWFAKAHVNRLWSELVGEGFYEPVDDMGPDRSCSAPNTLKLLADEFISHHYDVKWLFQTIVSTEAYQRESRSRRTPEETPFAANCSQRLRSDQLYDSLVQALGISENAGMLPGGRPGQGGGGYAGIARGPRQTFMQAFGYDPSTPRDEIAGSIPQALLLMNSPLVVGAIDGDRRNTTLGALLAKTKDDEAVVTELYLKCLAREPKPAEVQTCLAHLKEVNNRSEAFEDILWSLVNSTEFLHRK